MLELFALNIREPIEEQMISDSMKMVSPETAERIKRFRFKEDALRSLMGETMIRRWHCRRLHMDNAAIAIERNLYGKPFVVGSPYHYSISHSGDWVVCAISDNEVGIDIEEIKPIDFSLTSGFFTYSERLALNTQPNDKKLEYFYALWTLKESYIKYLGTGLSTPPDSFSFRLNGEKAVLSDPVRMPAPHFKQYIVDSRHKCALCSSTVESHNDFIMYNI